MRRVGAVIAFLSVATPAFADTTDTTPPPDNLPAVLVPPVVVEEQEPRYVAPTLRDRIGRIWAPVMINGKGPYRLVLDTGANSSAIIPSVARSLGVSLQESKKVKLHGVTGTAIVPIVMAESLEVGDLYIDGAPLPVVADVFGGAEGVLGPKGLGDKRIFIDFGNDTIRIQRSRNQAPAQGYTRVPVKFTQGLLTFEIRIGTIRTKAILDTGAQTTLGNDSLREALIRKRREGIDATVIGVTLDQQTGKSFSVPTISVGGIEVRNANVTFGDMFIFDKWDMNDSPAMIVGMDVIGTLDQLVIDYKMRELHMRTRR